MRRHIHYEAAFEDYLRSRGLPYVAVDEQRKAIFAGSRVKSFDFLLTKPGRPTWLIDVKGRKFPYETGGSRRYWENWITRDDLDGLEHWQRAFGAGFDGMLVFAYWLTLADVRPPGADVHFFRGEYYSFLAAPIEPYRQYSRPRSQSWDTLYVPTATFKQIVQPVHTPSDGSEANVG